MLFESPHRAKDKTERLGTGRMDSYLLKLERARHHLDTLDDEVKAFLDGNPGRILPEFDAATRRVTMTFLASDPPEALGALIGDFLFNLRSALDHLVYQLTPQDSGIDPRTISFPVYSDADEFSVRRSNGAPARLSGLYKIRGLPDGAQTAVERLQPYHDGLLRDQPLWLLNELCNIDKHRTVHIAVTNVKGGMLRLRYPPGSFHSDRPMRAATRSGTVIGSIVLDAAVVYDPQRIESWTECQIVLEERELSSLRSVTDRLGAMLNHVETRVIAELTQFL
jgi:hypothetical protein